MYVYLDESGDLGFGEGSTAYFTIAFVVVDNPIHYKRCVRSVKVKHNIPKAVELKGNATRETIKRDLLTRFAKLDAEVHSITVQKRNVDAKLRRDTNILYNYMVAYRLSS
ncbi:MAG: DUF3800 domain-containing protein, partial [Chloroflexi bacterium]|nr:DUF3800 domain-containing protein [Chloroflexota bacterium]